MTYFRLPRRKHIVTTKASELEAIEARLREMETRLNGGKAVAAPSSSAPAAPAAAAAQARPLEHRPRDQQQQAAQKHGGSRPGTARASKQAVPGALPPTPVGSEGE